MRQYHSKVRKLSNLINNLFSPGGSLKQKMVRGTFWVFLGKIVVRILILTRLVVLARILSPGDFGLIGIAILVMDTMETFSQTGFEQAIIQKKEINREETDISWTILILRSFLLSILMFFSAPFAAGFFKTPEASSIIGFMAFIFVLRGFTNIGVYFLKKDMDFFRDFLFNAAGAVVSLIVSVVLALLWKDVWALVYGIMAGEVVKLICSFFIHPYLPRLNFHFNKALEIFHYGKWLFLSNILFFSIHSIGPYVVGRLLNTYWLGLYQMAYRIATMPMREITHVIAQVMLPAYSGMQDDLAHFRETFIKVSQVVSFVTIPLTSIIMINAEGLVRIVLGEKWLEMVPVLQILCIYGGMESIKALSGPVFMALGRTDIEAKFPLFRFPLLAMIMIPLTIKWGIKGTALASVIAILTVLPGNFYMVAKLTEMKTPDVMKLLKMLLFPCIGIPGFIAGYYISRHLIPEDYRLTLLLSFMLGSLLYLMTEYFLDLCCGYGITGTLKKAFILMKKKGETGEGR